MFAVTIQSQGQTGPPTLDIAQTRRAYPLIPGPWFRLVHPAFVSRSEYVADMLIGQVIDPLVHLLSIQREQSCLHASAVERDGRAVAVVGAGGSGKTPAMLQLLQQGWRFLSDDWTTVDADGWIERSYKTLEIHAYDITTDQWMLNLLNQSQSPLSRIAWRLRSVGGPSPTLRRRVDPAVLLPSSLSGRRTRLSDVFIVKRCGQQDITLSKATPLQAAEAATDLTVQDLPTLNEVKALAARVPWPHMDGSEVESKTRSILCRAFAQTQITVVSLPTQTPDSEVGRVIAESMAAN